VRRLRDVVAGVALLGVLDRVVARPARPGGSRLGRLARRRAGADEAVAPRDPRLFRLMIGTFAVGAVLLLVFESGLAHTPALILLFAFIVIGVFLVADPRFLATAPPLEIEDDGDR
jgi:hypothetical protein